ncbi:hypothetical protein EFR25_03490, partial [Limosilactobacillus fermentum]
MTEPKKQFLKMKIDELRNDQLKIIAERENITKQSLVEKIINNYIDQRLLNDHLPELVDQLSKIGSSPKCWCKLNSANLSFHKL